MDDLTAWPLIPVPFVPLVDENLIERKPGGLFRLTTHPVTFVSIQLQPSLDIQVTALPFLCAIRSGLCLVRGTRALVVTGFLMCRGVCWEWNVGGDGGWFPDHRVSSFLSEWPGEAVRQNLL